MKAIGIDIGTTSISGVVWNGELRRAEEIRTIPNGAFLRTEHEWERVQDAELVLRKAQDLLEELLERHPDVASIGLTGQMHGIVYLDREGSVLSPLYTWQDGRCGLAGEDGRTLTDDIYEQTGLRVYTGYGLATHLWLMRAGEVPEEAVCLATIADAFGVRLTGRKRPLMHTGNAAGLGFYDARAHRFRTDALEILGVDCAVLPQDTTDFEVIGTYRGIPVTVALGDNQAAFLGAAGFREDTVLLNMGTGGQISVLSGNGTEVPGIELRPFTGDHWLLVGSSLCGGRAYAVLKDFYRAYASALGLPCSDDEIYRIMERLASKGQRKREAQTQEEGTGRDSETHAGQASNSEIVPGAAVSDGRKTAPAAGRLQVRTTFKGTRETPGLRGAVEGLSEDNFTPEDLTYGVLEGMARELYEYYRSLRDGAGIQVGRIVVSGNGLRRNAVLRQICADMFGMEVVLSPAMEEAACGAAISSLPGAAREGRSSQAKADGGEKKVTGSYERKLQEDKGR